MTTDNYCKTRQDTVSRQVSWCTSYQDKTRQDKTRQDKFKIQDGRLEILTRQVQDKTKTRQ